MKTLWVTALIGLSLASAMDAASAQGGRDYQYSEREYGSRSRDDREYDRRDYDDDNDRNRERDRGYDNDGERERSRGYKEDPGRGRDRSYDDDRGSERGRGYGEDRYRERQPGRGYDDDDRGRERNRRYREERETGFDEDEYLRCNPDVSRAVERGDMKSGEAHYRTFGRREGRRLTCPIRI